MKKQLLLLLAGLCWLSTLNAQIISRTLPQVGYFTTIQEMHLLTDGWLVIENATKSSLNTNARTFLVKLGLDGALIWQ